MQSFAKAVSGVQLPNDRMGDAQKRLTEIQEDPAVRELKMRFPFYPWHPIDLLDYGKEQRNCRSCPGLENCPNQQQGYRREFCEEDMNIRGNSPFRFVSCNERNASIKQTELSRLIKSHNVPSSVLAMTFEDLEPDAYRQLAIKAALKFCAAYAPNQTTGLYFRGSFGVGKSAICGAIAQALAKRGVDVAMVFVTDFLIEIKSAIKTGQVEEKINALKNVSVLILDDIGAEPLTTWTRDEVLAPILQARMEKLTTIYTSNLTMQQLESHLAYTKDGGNDPIKAARIMQRIEPFVSIYEVGGRNRRLDGRGA